MNFKTFVTGLVVVFFLAIGTAAYSQDDTEGSKQSQNIPDEVTKTKPAPNSNYDASGYDANGFDINGFDKNGYDKNGYDKYGYNSDGLDVNGKFEGNTENYIEKQRKKNEKPAKQVDDGDHQDR